MSTIRQKRTRPWAPLCMHLSTVGGQKLRIQFVDGAHRVEDAYERVVAKARCAQVVNVGLAVELESILPVVHRPSCSAGNRTCIGVGETVRRIRTWG